MTQADKSKLKSELVSALAGDEKIEKIVIFGSFPYVANPHDMDVAVFCVSQDDYLTLALELRRKLRSLSKIIPIDLLPYPSRMTLPRCFCRRSTRVKWCMKKDTELWLQYADENLRSAEILLDSDLYNPSLQNSQQAVEKYLKALLIEKAAGLTRTHSIRELSGLVSDLGVRLTMSDDDIDLLDSIYPPRNTPHSAHSPDSCLITVSWYDNSGNVPKVIERGENR